MTFDNVTDMRIGSKKVKEAWLNGRQVYPSKKRIMDSMVLWYDIARQGATNESMAANPKLIDLSGNGHDATCYNFAWRGMSGIGGYGQDFSRWNIQNSNYEELINRTYNSLKIRLTNIPSNIKISLTYVSKTNYSASAYKVKVYSTNNDLEFILRFLFDNGSPEKNISLVQNVETDIQLTEEEYTNLQNNNPILTISNGDMANVGDEITFELLPEYPNALVSDGVDDYAQVTGLPILTKERGYTVVAKRKIWHKERNAFVSKCTHWLAESEGGVNGAFNIQANGSGIAYSFGKSNNNVPGMNEDVIYQTSKLCNGSPIQVGDKEDTDQMAFFSINSGTTWYTKAALYSFLLFDRDLTEQEIEWVKTNLMN